jgi:hypothetical protein
MILLSVVNINLILACYYIIYKDIKPIYAGIFMTFLAIIVSIEEEKNIYEYNNYIKQEIDCVVLNKENSFESVLFNKFQISLLYKEQLYTHDFYCFDKDCIDKIQRLKLYENIKCYNPINPAIFYPQPLYHKPIIVFMIYLFLYFSFVIHYFINQFRVNNKSFIETDILERIIEI